MKFQGPDLSMEEIDSGDLGVYQGCFGLIITVSAHKRNLHILSGIKLCFIPDCLVSSSFVLTPNS